MAEDPLKSKRSLGRRRRRLYRTILILVAAGLLGGAIGFAVYRAKRPETYRTGEDHAEITSRLDLGIPEDAPEPGFSDVTAEAGLAGFRSFAGDRTSQLPEDMGSGAAWGDYDNDGDDDLFLVSNGGPLGARTEDLVPSLLYENLGDGAFARATGFPDLRIIGMGAAWGDYDGDGWLDLVVTGYDSLLLFRNDGGTLRIDLAIPGRDGYWSGASWTDFDRDGDLDLYVCGYVEYREDPGGRIRTSQQYGQAVPYTLNPASFDPAENLLFRNTGRGTFEEVAREIGVANAEGRSLGALWKDFDGDGWVDLYVANDISDNVLYLNREGSFEDASHAAWVADYRGAMGLTHGDWNRDGDDDLFVTHWIAQENALYDSLLSDFADRPGAAEGLRFMDVADQRGLGQIALQLVGWGAEFADFDGDGWLDLAVANGSTFETDEEPRRLRPQPSFLFWSNRGKSFHELGRLNPAISAPHVSRGLAVSDYDGDGDLDLLIVDRDAGVRLLRNEMQSGNWIEIRLRRTHDREGRGNRVVEGSLVTVDLGEVTLRRTLASVSYLSQSTRTLHFGLGTSARVDSLEVLWPEGNRDVHQGLAANTIWEVTEGEAPRAIGRPGEIVERPAAKRSTSREQVAEFWEKQRAAMRAVKVDGDFRAAIPLFEEALALNPRHGDSLYYLGNCLAETGDADGALERFAEMIRLDPLSHRAHKRWGTLRAMTARNRQDLEQAESELERAVSINPEETGALQASGEVALMLGALGTARERLELVVRTNPRSEGALFLLAYLAWKRSDGDDAVSLLTRAGEARGEDWKPEGSAAEGDVRQKMHTEATPLERFITGWDGSIDPEQVFSGLESHLKREFSRPSG